MRLLNDTLYNYFAAKVNMWESSAHEKDEGLEDLVARFFFYVGDLSWAGAPLEKALEELAELLLVFSKILKLKSKWDETFKSELYPAMLRVVSTALAGAEATLLELRIKRGSEVK